MTMPRTASAESVRLVHARPGAPFRDAAGRVRERGRIGGLAGIADADGSLGRALAAGLGPGAMLLVDGLAVDWDACTLDQRAVASLAEWQSTLHAGRLSEVRGAFAIAWRARDGSVTLARDAIGERTLYYAAIGSGLAFASTLRALLATGLVAKRIDPIAVALYLSCAYLPGERTMIEGVRELLPGETLAWSPAGARAARFWSLPPEPSSAAPFDEVAATLDLRTLLETAVSRRLPPDPSAPIAATLSGGIDSSLVVALARRAHPGPLATWSISFGTQYRNELEFSSAVAAHCATDHRILELPPNTVLAHLDDTIALLSDPIGDPLTVPNALAFRAAGEETGVVLNGEGGDPCFGGPKNLPMLLAALLGDGAGGGPIGAHGVEAVQWSRERSFLRAHEKCFPDLRSMLAAPVAAALAEDPLEHFVRTHFADSRWTSFVTRLQAMNLGLKGAHHILHKVDEVSFPFGVVPRSPLFDRDVAEFAFGLAPAMRLQGAVEKYLLKRAVADLLPPTIIDRPKSGMLVPVEAWFRGPLLPHARERLLDGLGRRNLFERDYLERLLAGRLPGLRPRHGAKIWLLVTLEAWLRTVLG